MADSVSEYLAQTPSDEETAEDAVARYRDMTPQQRWAAFERLLAEIERLLGDREPLREVGPHPFWRHWTDPSLGRPE